MKKYLLICCLVASSSALAQVYKCNIGGKTSYADRPCASASASTVVPIQSSAAPITVEEQARKTKQALLKIELDRRASIRAGIHAGEPVISMTETDLYAALGNPNRINNGNYHGSIQNQLIYERPNRTWYVYTENGIVTSIQDSPTIHAKRKCPSNEEIAKWEFDRSKIENRSEYTQERFRSRIADARDCQRNN